MKKRIIMATVIILAVVIAVVAIVTLSKKDKKDAKKEDAIELVEEVEEEASTETDNDMPEESAKETETTGTAGATTETSKEVIRDGNTGNESKNELSEKQQSFQEEFTKIYTEHSQNKKHYEGLDIDTELKCAEIYFNNDDEVDYLFKGVEIFYLLIAEENGYSVYDGLITGTHSSEYYYIEKTGTFIHFATGYYGDGGYDVYQLNDSYEEEYQYYIGSECIMDSNYNPIFDENGEPQKMYVYSDKYERFEITAEEYAKKLDELEKKWTSLYDVPYQSLDEFSWYKEFTH